MWIYSQETGRLWHEGVYVVTGYSGYDQGKNNPDEQATPFVGPIPRGLYQIGEPYYSNNVGDFALPLTPVDHDCLGRTDFLFHGDSRLNPGEASRGCVIMPLPVRKKIHQSGDRYLLVIE